MSHYGPSMYKTPTHTWDGSAWILNSSQQNSAFPLHHSGGPASSGQASSLAGENYRMMQQLVAQRNTSSDDVERRRLAAWAEYYRLQITSEYQQYQFQKPNQEPPRVVSVPPPALPPHKLDPISHTSAANQVAQQSATVPIKQHASSGATHPDSLKRYVQKSLSNCVSDEQREMVQTEIQAVIALSIKAGTMWSTDWDLISSPSENTCLALPPAPTPTHGRSSVRRTVIDGLPPNSKKGRWSSRDDSSCSSSHDGSSYNSSYYGHTKSSLSQLKSQSISNQDKVAISRGSLSYSKKDKCYALDLPTNDSYYGGSGNNENSVNFTTKKFVSKQKKQVKSKSKKNGGIVVSNSKSLPGFHVKNDASILKKRARRFESSSGPDCTESFVIKNAQYMGMGVIGGSNKILGEDEYEEMTVKGTCLVPEKEYLRLTAPPKAEKVRPQQVLEAHLRNLKKMWNEESCEYPWICSQFKAVRQDLKVQRMGFEKFSTARDQVFTIDCYETHARIALECEDLNEFNQCQTQLWELYQVCDNYNGVSNPKNRCEFISYRIIYYVFLTFCNSKYDGGSSDLLNLMLMVSRSEHISKDKCVLHALEVRRAVAENDHINFFRLHAVSPLMSSYLMDFMVPTIRYNALKTIVKAYRPDVPTTFLLNSLGFTDSDEAEEGMAWLKSCGCFFNDDETSLLVTLTTIHASNLENGKNSLI